MPEARLRALAVQPVRQLTRLQVNEMAPADVLPTTPMQFVDQLFFPALVNHATPPITQMTGDYR